MSAYCAPRTCSKDYTSTDSVKPQKTPILYKRKLRHRDINKLRNCLLRAEFDKA